MNWLGRVWLRMTRALRGRPRTSVVLAPPRVPPGTSSLSGLLDALDEIGLAHPELFDTDVREQIWAVVEARYVRLNREVVAPQDLGMFSPEANEKLRRALDLHLTNLVMIADVFRLDTKEQRLRTLVSAHAAQQRDATDKGATARMEARR